MGGDAAIMEAIEPEYNSDIVEELDEFVEGVTENNTRGLGKFSLYFVIFATIFVLFIFAYSLIRLIRQCQKKRDGDRDKFCRAEDEEENAVNYN